MSVIDAGLTTGEAGPYPQLPQASPFAPATLVQPARVAEAEFDVPAAPIVTPFAEAFAGFGEADLEAEAQGMLRAEFEDEDFLEALEALADEAAARHLAAASSWGGDPRALAMADAEVQQWMAEAGERADRLLTDLETHFGDRPASEAVEGEIDAVAGARQGVAGEGPLDARELFLGTLVSKVRKVATGVGKLVAKGVRAVGKLLPLGKLFAFLRKLLRPLLQRVLQKAIGKLPPQLQPAARRLATHFGPGPGRGHRRGRRARGTGRHRARNGPECHPGDPAGVLRVAQRRHRGPARRHRPGLAHALTTRPPPGAGRGRGRGCGCG